MKSEISGELVFFISLFIATFLIFMILKLMNIITWSWWVITIPLWGPIIFIGIIFIIAFIIIITLRNRL